MLLPASSILTPVWCINALLVFFLFCFLLFTPTWCMLVFLFYAWCVTASYCLHPYGVLTRWWFSSYSTPYGALALPIASTTWCFSFTPHSALIHLLGFLLVLHRTVHYGFLFAYTPMVHYRVAGFLLILHRTVHYGFLFAYH